MIINFTQLGNEFTRSVTKFWHKIFGQQSQKWKYYLPCALSEKKNKALIILQENIISLCRKNSMRAQSLTVSYSMCPWHFRSGCFRIMEKSSRETIQAPNRSIGSQRHLFPLLPLLSFKTTTLVAKENLQFTSDWNCWQGGWWPGWIFTGHRHFSNRMWEGREHTMLFDKLKEHTRNQWHDLVI